MGYENESLIPYGVPTASERSLAEMAARYGQLTADIHKISSQIDNLKQTAPEKPDTSWAYWLPRTQSGVTVDHETALTYATVWACTQVICGSVAQMGWHVYAPAGRGRERVPTHPADWLLDVQANPETTAFSFRESMLRYALLWGNAYAEIERDLSGRPVWLWLITPERVLVDRDPDGNLIYVVRNKGQSDSVFDPVDILHLKGLGDGVTGLSVIAHARQSIGLGLAAERFGSSFFGNGARPGVVLEHPGTLSEPAQERLKKNFMKRNSGPNALGVDVLEEDMKLKTFSIPPEDAQFLETRVHQVLEVCRWFNVKPHKVAELTRATFSNIEEQNIEHVVDTCLPWVLRLEQEANVKLFGQNRKLFYTKMNVSSLLRGKVNDRYAAYSTGRQWGWLSVNDIRALEDMNPLPSHIGDLYLVPQNMWGVPLDPSKPMLGATPQQSQPRQTEPPSQPAEEPLVDPEDRLRDLLARRVANAAHARNGALPL